MRDQDLVHRAEEAAAELERAWYCWRSTQGFETDPMPTVSSYVGFSQQEPWGQPRVILGIPAEDAEELAGLLVQPDQAGSARVQVADQVGLEHHEPPDGPVFHQVTATRLRAIEGPGAVGNQFGSGQIAVTVPGTLPGAVLGEIDFVMAEASPASPDLVDKQPPGLVVAGPWTMAASTARAEAEARIRDYLRGAVAPAGQQAPPAQPSAAEKRSADVAVGSDADQNPSDGRDVAPGLHARRSRVTRGYQIPKLSRAKRPGTVPGL